MAWFTSNPEEVKNTFTAGTVKIGVKEEFEAPKNWNPGDTTKKDVNIEVESSKQTYVRVLLTPKWEDINGAPLANDFVSIEFAEPSYWVDEAGNPVSGVININEIEGYYYYTKIVTSENSPLHLIDEVKFLGESTIEEKQDQNKYQGATFTLTVKAEAVQAFHKAYKDVWELDSLPEGVELWQDPNATPEE